MWPLRHVWLYLFGIHTCRIWLRCWVSYYKGKIYVSYLSALTMWQSHTQALLCLSFTQYVLDTSQHTLPWSLSKLGKNFSKLHFELLGPVVQSVVSLTSSLRVISLTVLADSIYNILIFFAEKMWVAFALQKLLTFFQQKLSAYLRITLCKF